MTGILRSPDGVIVDTEAGRMTLSSSKDAALWQAKDVGVELTTDGNTLRVVVSAPNSAVNRLCMRWNTALAEDLLIMGDHWERGYGDLAWRTHVPERILPWYFLTRTAGATHGYGVKTAARSLCFWQVDPQGITLWIDVRCGSRGVLLGDRRLEAATVVYRGGRNEESAFQAARELCRELCDNPRGPRAPVYGGNNWYYAYGKSSSGEVLRDAGIVSELSPSQANRPFMVIDDGWQLSGPCCGGGPWRFSNRDFPDMASLAAGIAGMGVRPGIWMRPLLTRERLPESWFLPGGRGKSGSDILDPSVPEVLHLVAEEIKTLTGWGYELIKHDFTTFDLLGLWGYEMGASLTQGDWSFSDRSHTTAEVVFGLYRTIREAAGSALILGCNTIGHIGAGLIDVQRTGDDTSGREWERTRKMGINTLAYRMAQHDSFFAVDADCVGITNYIPWDLNSQWLDLLARSGTPLFASISPDALGAAQRKALKAAFAHAAEAQPVAEPLDWTTTTCPEIWNCGGNRLKFDWYGSDGTNPFGS